MNASTKRVRETKFGLRIDRHKAGGLSYEQDPAVVAARVAAETKRVAWRVENRGDMAVANELSAIHAELESRFAATVPTTAAGAMLKLRQALACWLGCYGASDDATAAAMRRAIDSLKRRNLLEPNALNGLRAAGREFEDKADFVPYAAEHVAAVLEAFSGPRVV
jgi:hypothetical protein